MRLLFILCFVSLQASAVDKIFMSKAERDILDAMQASGQFSIKDQSANEHKTNTRLDGVVFKSGKDPVIFVDGKNTINSKQINQSLHVHTKNLKAKNTRVLVTKNKSSRYMKPGQVWSSSKAKVAEEYQYKSLE